MVDYLLRPNEKFKKAANEIGGINIIVEGKAVLGLITEGRKFPKISKNLRSYLIDREHNSITVGINLDPGLPENLIKYLNKNWDITEIRKYNPNKI